MKKGFYTIMAAQFFSSLADNALLIAAIALLKDLHAPNWMTPLLKLFFVLSYVVLAAFVGAFADSRPKGHVMFVTNSIKVVGCLTMLVGAHPLLAYGIVGFGAAAYSPAKYGILTELLPADRLVAANGWIEGTTVGSIILGTVMGGALISPHIAGHILSLHIPRITTPAEAAMLVIVLMYVIAAMFNLRIPDTGARYPKQETRPLKLITDFADCFVTLWRDKLGQISLAVTTLFWGAGATLQFIVLKWAEVSLGMSLSQAAILQAIIAVGVAVGAILAAARVPLKRSLTVLPVGIIMGIAVMLMAFYTRDLFPAGWGLQILTNALPGGGNGTYRLLVFAEDTEGHTTLLGTRTFTAANATATIPFGNIDTPSAGQTVSGTIINFGWALTPPPAFIAGGSTIDVLVDGAVVGHPTYGFARSDIDTFFPGYMNSGAAVGYFILDTTPLTNGLHTIAWVVHDNLGGTQGIGSRVFFVDNP